MSREEAIKWKPEIEAFQQGKTIQYKDLIRKEWTDNDKPAFKLDCFYRIKPEPTKRLPTIEEVEQWLLENKVFYHNLSNTVTRIIVIDRNQCEKQIGLQGGWLSINTFCNDFTHYDGSKLYITE